MRLREPFAHHVYKPRTEECETEPEGSDEADEHFNSH